jgi:hypothetical protein
VSGTKVERCDPARERLGYLEGVLIPRESIETTLQRRIATCGSVSFWRGTRLHSCVSVSSALQAGPFGLPMRETVYEIGLGLKRLGVGLGRGLVLGHLPLDLSL